MDDQIKKVNSRKYILLMTLPIFVELILQMVVGYVDQYMISSYNENCVASITNANSITNLLVLTFSVLSTASLILLGQYKGAKETENENKIYSLAFFMNLIISVIVSIFIVTLSPMIFKLMNVDQVIFDDAVTYIRITGSFMVVQAMILTFSSFLRSNALMKQTMIVSFVINIINVILNAILINGLWIFPEMGIAGVAWASSISRSIGLMVLVFIFYRNIGNRIKLANLKPFPKDILKKLLFIGLPSSGENFSYNMSQIVILGYVNLLGPSIVNARTYSNILATFSYIFAAAVAQALIVTVSRLIGAKMVDEASHRVKDTLKIAIVISTLCSILLFLLQEPLFRIFTDDVEIIKIGRTIMFVEIFLEVGRCINIVLVRALQSAGDINFPIILSIISCWGIAVLIGYVFGIVFNWGLVGIWIAMAVDECLRGMIFVFRWYQGKWKRMKLIN